MGVSLDLWGNRWTYGATVGFMRTNIANTQNSHAATPHTRPMNPFCAIL